MAWYSTYKVNFTTSSEIDIKSLDDNISQFVKRNTATSYTYEYTYEETIKYGLITIIYERVSILLRDINNIHHIEAYWTGCMPQTSMAFELNLENINKIKNLINEDEVSDDEFSNEMKDNKERETYKIRKCIQMHKKRLPVISN
jgi:hypothetical protein